MSNRIAVTAGLTGVVALVAAGGAQAAHTHVKELGNGQCVVLAEGAGEERVNLPGAVFLKNPNVTVAAAAGRNHPLHVLVHKGRPGAGGGYHVQGPALPAQCSGYVNR